MVPNYIAPRLLNSVTCVYWGPLVTWSLPYGTGTVPQSTRHMFEYYDAILAVVLPVLWGLFFQQFYYGISAGWFAKNTLFLSFFFHFWLFVVQFCNTGTGIPVLPGTFQTVLESIHLQLLGSPKTNKKKFFFVFLAFSPEFDFKVNKKCITLYFQ